MLSQGNTTPQNQARELSVAKETERADGRRFDELRPMAMELQWNDIHPGSVMASTGKTKVIVVATIKEGPPDDGEFRKPDDDQGWLIARYRMLPYSTEDRRNRSEPDMREIENQQLIQRTLRGALDIQKLGNSTIVLDCSVIQADGGTKTLAINAGWVAIKLLLADLIQKKELQSSLDEVLPHQVCAVSIGYKGEEMLVDMDYKEDSSCDVDSTFVLREDDQFLLTEIQGEEVAVSLDRSISMMKEAIKQAQLIRRDQRRAIEGFISLIL